MIVKWLYKKYLELDILGDEIEYKIFVICATIIFFIFCLLDIFLIIPEFLYCLIKTLYMILKGDKYED